MKIRSLPLDELTIDDERSLRHVGLYAELKAALRRDGYRFLVPEGGASWDEVLFLNLTFWSPSEGGDLLTGDHVPADVVTHVAWHHLASRPLGLDRPKPAVEGMLLAEAIASAFDLYLVGRLLGRSPDSEFLESQVPAMAEAAEAAGLTDEGFEALLAEVAKDPDQAFEDLRSLLFDAGVELVRCSSIESAAAVLERLKGHRFAPLLHHYELSTWILHARAGGGSLESDAAARAVDSALRSAPVALDWLEENWVRGGGQEATPRD
ncbi:hypothetical protein [Chondromyces crocatus]|uniref:Uncharacterized protein n=1 Tax=Chondromyces crocatus TaxID=52 RepID=A0A0K1EAY1_CHOCO|nr:hypothetical protein [Chondromyces crocatus]AKT38025.1 uncharacterized protein CMC5_021660 [Chondromyces crocatus]